MSIRFSCHCGKQLKVADDKGGKKVRCPDCGELLRVPASRSKKGRTRFVVIEEEAPETEASQLDWGATLRSFAFLAVPALLAVVVLSYAGYWLMSWAMSTSPDVPPLGSVSGVVTLDGKPLDGASVVFRPVAGQEAGSGIGASFGRSDEAGRYTMVYSASAEGAAIGEHVVEISALDEIGRQRVPAMYNARTRLVKTVEEGRNQINLELESR